MNFIVKHNDPGHGWYQVDRSELVSAGVADKISDYSYQNGDRIYLEEDSDARLFFEKQKEEKQIVQKYYDERCFIRNLPAYKTE